jgi:hypothetical protein
MIWPQKNWMCIVWQRHSFPPTTQIVLGLAILALSAALLAAQPSATAQTSQHQKTRSFALVIGQSDYIHGSKLANARNDAVAMNSTLRDLGFESTLVLNAGKAAIDRAVREFSQRVRNADVVFVYYAGHAIQHRSTFHRADRRKDHARGQVR